MADDKTLFTLELEAMGKCTREEAMMRLKRVLKVLGRTYGMRVKKVEEKVAVKA